MKNVIVYFSQHYRKALVTLALVLAACCIVQLSRTHAATAAKPPPTKVGIVIYSGDPETVWNAFRFANFALNEGDQVKVFLLAKGVECESLDNDKFKITEMMQTFAKQGGQILACGTCLHFRHSEGSKLCPLSTLQDMYNIVKESDRVLTF
jgi:sulfur relay (sulfurtransferase) complex TusBCD TusD component (DsrE family)